MILLNQLLFLINYFLFCDSLYTSHLYYVPIMYVCIYYIYCKIHIKNVYKFILYLNSIYVFIVVHNRDYL